MVPLVIFKPSQILIGECAMSEMFDVIHEFLQLSDNFESQLVEIRNKLNKSSMKFERSRISADSSKELQSR